VKKLVRILAVALVATASYAAVSTPATSIEKGQTLSLGSAPLPDCPPGWCSAAK
jgi:hypothetical protein